MRLLAVVGGIEVTYLDRILDDGTDRDRWMAARRPVVTASTAKTLAKITSVPLYLAAKLSDGDFGGNHYTESGNRWEPLMLAWAGIPGNKALIHSPAELGFAATPDGLNLLPDSSVVLAECKAKHMKIITGPDRGEWRQIAWQFEAVPEAEELEWIWVELDRDGEIRAGLNGEPRHLTIRRSDPRVQSALAQVRPIATELLARLRVALSYERHAA